MNVEQDYDRFLAALKTFAAVFGKTLSDEQVQVYWKALQDRTIEQIERKLQDYAKRGRFFPKPRDLRPIEPDVEKIESNPAAEARFKALIAENTANWNALIAKEPIHRKLLLADALWARYTVAADQGGVFMAEKYAWLRGRIRELITEARTAGVPVSYEEARLRLHVFAECVAVGQLQSAHA